MRNQIEGAALEGFGGLGQLRLLPSVAQLQTAAVANGVGIGGFVLSNMAWSTVVGFIPEQVKGIHPAVTPALKVLAGVLVAPLVGQLIPRRWGISGAATMGVSLGLVGTGLWGIAKAFEVPLPDAGFSGLADPLAFAGLSGAALAVEEEEESLSGIGAAPLLVETPEFDPLSALA